MVYGVFLLTHFPWLIGIFVSVADSSWLLGPGIGTSEAHNTMHLVIQAAI